MGRLKAVFTGRVNASEKRAPVTRYECNAFECNCSYYAAAALMVLRTVSVHGCKDVLIQLRRVVAPLDGLGAGNYARRMVPPTTGEGSFRCSNWRRYRAA